VEETISVNFHIFKVRIALKSSR